MYLTITIPTRNRSALLCDLLDSIAQLVPVDFRWEVLVIDNNSSDNTGDVVKIKQKQYDYKLRYFLEKNIGLHYCRNRAANEARGVVLGYLDDDMLLDKKWHTFSEKVSNDVHWVGGKVLPIWEGEIPNWMCDFWDETKTKKKFGYLGLIDLGNVSKKVKPWFIYGGGCFVKRELVKQVGGFNPDSFPQELIKYRGDGETGFAYKLQDAGLNAVYYPGMITYHRIGPERLTVDYLYKRAFNQGISDSYSEIRKYGLSGPPKTVRKRLSWLRTNIISFLRPESDLQHKIRKSLQAGRKFHHNEVMKDPQLLTWIQKPSYMEEYRY